MQLLSDPCRAQEGLQKSCGDYIIAGDGLRRPWWLSVRENTSLYACWSRRGSQAYNIYNPPACAKAVKTNLRRDRQRCLALAIYAAPNCR